MDFFAILKMLLEMFNSCNNSRQARAGGRRGRIARTLALRRAAAKTGADWRTVTDDPAWDQFLEYGFTDEDLEQAETYVSLAIMAERADDNRCGNQCEEE